MDPLTNPYAPGAGSPPPELAGRDELLDAVQLAIRRIRAGRHAKSPLLIGLRGVGKTVLLRRMADAAGAEDCIALAFEATVERSLPALLSAELRRALLALDRSEAARDTLQRAWRGLASFVGSVRLAFQDVELRLDVEPEPGLADMGDLASDMADMFQVVGEAARAAGKAVVLFIDEMQSVGKSELAALIAALHLCQQKTLPVAIVGAGLPQLAGRTGEARSYAERLFEFREVGRLDRDAAFDAIAIPAEKQGGRFSDPALEEIFRQTDGYPYFLQEWGYDSWNAAGESPVALEDVRAATPQVLAKLDAGFFRVRYDRCTARERRYLRAMAQLGPGPHRSGDIAEAMGRPVTSVAPLRSALIAKGMIYSPAHGDTAFTVPAFDGFMRRAMPDG